MAVIDIWIYLLFVNAYCFSCFLSLNYEIIGEVRNNQKTFYNFMP